MSDPYMVASEKSDKSDDEDSGKGQMGSALTGSPQILCVFFAEGVFGTPVKCMVPLCCLFVHDRLREVGRRGLRGHAERPHPQKLY